MGMRHFELADHAIHMSFARIEANGVFRLRVEHPQLGALVTWPGALLILAKVNPCRDHPVSLCALPALLEFIRLRLSQAVGKRTGDIPAADDAPLW